VNRRVLVVGLLVVLPLVGILLLNIGRDPHSIRSPLIGKAAPAFRLDKLSGGAPIALADFKGKPVVINFWATWCVPCMQEHPTMVEASQRLRDQVKRLDMDLKELKAVTTKAVEEKKKLIDEQAFLLTYVKQAEANVKYYYDLLDKISAAEAAHAAAAAAAAAAAKNR